MEDAMKKLSLVTLMVLSAFSLRAANVRPARLLASRTVISVDAQTVTDPTLLPRVLDQARQVRAAVRASVLTDSRSARSFFIPVAGSTPGAAGLFFRSDVTLVNYGAAAESVLVGFWPAGTSNPPSTTAPNTKIISVPANQSTRYIDFVASVMGTQGVGALVFIPLSGTSFDGNAAIDGFSRIYTKQPGSDGTVSQPFEAIDVFSASVQIEVVALGLQQDSAFRTNFGILNSDPVPHTYTVTFLGDTNQATATVTVPAFGMIQQAAPTGDFGALTVIFTLTDPGTSNLAWIAFASSTDNITGDGWVSVASSDFTPNDLLNLGF
jgi:hypothetical protein